ncbi:hypothetical protein BAE44_0026411 [Dichanthelium oligosanthes]|uniref:Bacterial surface antigen (D15) domain-containing protein n=1 Tax=Dichanthelium oligosanthes TaxID=888268 RepID=A0A1E5UI69_9POAL|nr:hypothetical protein BAE44_0026411 [Dichanthelium oligosanthes]
MAAAADPAADQNPKPEDAKPHDTTTRAEDEGHFAEGEYEEDGEEEYEEEEEEEEELDGPAAAAAERERVQSVFRRLSSDPVGIRVHDVVIKGNTKTRDDLIEAEVADLLRAAPTVQDLLRAASVATGRLHKLDVFDAVKITLDAGPPELPGTTNVVIEVVEAANPLTGTAGVYSKPEARSWSLEGSLKLKNLFGYGDIWDASGSYGWDQTTEVGVGVYLPRFKSIPTPLMARASLSSQDWLKFSSYKERLFGLSFGLLSTINHDLSYNLTWRTLTDPSRTSSKAIRRQLGHNLLSALKYTYKIDERDSLLRPTKGYAFQSTSQIGGLWDFKGLRFFRQVIPLSFHNFMFFLGPHRPCMKSLMSVAPCLWDSIMLLSMFFLGGHSSPVCSLSGLSSLLGFRTRGVGPTEARRLVPKESDSGSAAAPGRDYLGGDLAVSAFADLSFDLPLKLFRDAGIHGHAFLTAGNLAKLSEGEYKNFSVSEFQRTFRSSAGVGIILPTKLFRVEVNYCYILKQAEHDSGKTGIQFSFSSPM